MYFKYSVHYACSRCDCCLAAFACSLQVNLEPKSDLTQYEHRVRVKLRIKFSGTWNEWLASIEVSVTLDRASCHRQGAFIFWVLL